MSNIKQLLAVNGIKSVHAAKACGMSPSAFSLAINRNIWPAKDAAACKKKIKDYMAKLAAKEAQPVPAVAETFKQEEPFMVIPKQTLLPKTRRAFMIHGEPFGDDLGGPEGVFLSDGYRYVRESMLYAAKHGGFMAVIGESGSGKSTLKKDLKARIVREKLDIVVAEPYVLGMEEDDKAGKTLKAYHIAEAVIHAIYPKVKIQASPEALFKQAHDALINAAEAGKRVVLIIDEAHGLPKSTIKHLKRFNELEHNFTRLLAIILLGQTELNAILWEGNAELREVVQRIEKVHMEAIDDLQGYIRHRLALCNLDFERIISPDALDALRLKLKAPDSHGGTAGQSKLFPLAVGNMLTAGLNLAAELGEKTVTGAIINNV